jgi:CubicO group peptidase (beta-lactamase class C family)
MKTLLALILSLLIPPAFCQTDAQKAGASATNQVKALVDGYMNPLLSGPLALRDLVVGVVHGGQKEVWGYGKVGRNGAIPDGESLFQIASATKPLTALLLAQLVAEGKVTYDEVAISFKGNPVTYQQLVTHTSGLPVLPSTPRADSAEDFRRYLGEYSLTREPGSRFEYSVFGFNVLGLCLAGKCRPDTFEAGLTRKILAPLGMSSTVFELPKASEWRFAGDALPQPRQNGPNPYNASGGLISSADDLLRFISANLQAQSQPKLAKALALTQQIPSPEIQTFPGCVAALGWEVMVVGPAHYYWYAGVGPGRALIAFDPGNDAGVVILTRTWLEPFDTRMDMAGFSLLGAVANMKLK